MESNPNVVNNAWAEDVGFFYSAVLSVGYGLNGLVSKLVARLHVCEIVEISRRQAVLIREVMINSNCEIVLARSLRSWVGEEPSIPEDLSIRDGIEFIEIQCCRGINRNGAA